MKLSAGVGGRELVGFSFGNKFNVGGGAEEPAFKYCLPSNSTLADWRLSTMVLFQTGASAIWTSRVWGTGVNPWPPPDFGASEK